MRFVMLFAAALLAVATTPFSASAHDLRFADVKALFNEDGTYEISLSYDIDALLAGVEPGHATREDMERLSKMGPEELREGLERLEQLFVTRTRVYFDEQEVEPEFVLPDYANGKPLYDLGPSWNPEGQKRPVLLRGAVPEGAETFVWGSQNLGESILRLSREMEGEVETQPLGKDGQSRPFPLKGPVQALPVMQMVGQYFYLGFEHIVPSGIDHILFVLGLFLLTERFRPLFWQITAFTLAHSVTLALGVFDVVELNSAYVETLVAMSIAYVAIENLFTKELKWWRPIVVFGFGLLHGLGFAGGLKEIGLPKGQFLAALATFNIGVEVGHLTVVAIAFLTVGWFRHKAWYRPYIVVPMSCMIAAVALLWSAQRVWGLIAG